MHPDFDIGRKAFSVVATVTSILSSPIMNPDPVAAYTSPAAVRRARPFFLRPIPIQFHAVVIRIAQIECFAHAMIRRSFERDACLLQPPQRIRQFRPRRIQDGQMIKPRRSRRRRLAAGTLPGIQSDVMMIPARREKCRRRSETLRQLKPKHITIKSKGALQVRHLQMHVAHPDIGMNCFRGHALMSRYKRYFRQMYREHDADLGQRLSASPLTLVTWSRVLVTPACSRMERRMRPT